MLNSYFAKMHASPPQVHLLLMEQHEQTKQEENALQAERLLWRLAQHFKWVAHTKIVVSPPMSTLCILAFEFVLILGSASSFNPLTTTIVAVGYSHTAYQLLSDRKQVKGCLLLHKICIAAARLKTPDDNDVSTSHVTTQRDQSSSCCNAYLN